MPALLRVAAVAAVIASASASAAHGCSGPECTKEPADSKVNVLNAGNFHRFIKRHPMTLMEFYAPWCGHCQSMSPEFRAAAAEIAEMDLPTPVAFAKMDDGDEANRALRAGSDEMYNYSSYPTLMLFRGDPDPTNKCNYTMGHPGARTIMKDALGKEIAENTNKEDCWEFYGGGREYEDFSFWLSTVSKGLNPFDEEAKLKPGLYKEAGHCEKPCPVYDLDPDNFNETVIANTPENNRVWVVEFYSDRCPICKGLVPEVRRAAIELMKDFPGQITLGAVNSRVYHELAEAWGIKSYPWVTSFYKGEKIEDMAGLGGWQSIYNWGKKKFDEKWEPMDGQVLGCKGLKDAGSLGKAEDVAVGDTVVLTADEAKVASCVAEKGKEWEGKMKDKRGPLLGKSGVVKEVDTGRDVVQVTFDGVDMWWAPVYLTKADGKEL